MASRTAKEWAALEEATATNMNKMAGGWIGYSSNSSDQTGITTATDLTSITVDVTVNTSRLIRVDVIGRVIINTASANYVGRILRDGSNIGTWCEIENGAATDAEMHPGWTYDLPSSGAHTYKANLARSSGTGTLDVEGTAPSNAKILVVDYGSTS